MVARTCLFPRGFSQSQVQAYSDPLCPCPLWTGTPLLHFVLSCSVSPWIYLVPWPLNLPLIPWLLVLALQFHLMPAWYPFLVWWRPGHLGHTWQIPGSEHAAVPWAELCVELTKCSEKEHSEKCWSKRRRWAAGLSHPKRRDRGGELKVTSWGRAALTTQKVQMGGGSGAGQAASIKRPGSGRVWLDS